MSRIIDLRRKNLQRLIEKRFDGKQKNFTTSTGIAPSQISQWLSTGDGVSTRNISERSARRLEVRLGLPAGWLDHDHERSAFEQIGVESALAEVWPFTSSPEVVASLPAEDRDIIDRMISRLSRDRVR
ncbi:hypothetical protein [Castellaniella sp. UC4442_H9]